MSSSAAPPGEALFEEEKQLITTPVHQQRFSEYKSDHPGCAAIFVKKLRELVQLQQLSPYLFSQLNGLIVSRNQVESSKDFISEFGDEHTSQFIELAFIRRYPKYYKMKVISLDEQRRVVDMTLDEGTSYLDMLTSDPSPDTLLHGRNAKKFKIFAKSVSGLVAEYLERLAELFKLLTLSPKSAMASEVIQCIDEGPSDAFVEAVNNDSTHEAKFVELAFLRRYPTFYQNENVDYRTRKEVLGMTQTAGLNHLGQLISATHNIELVQEAFNAVYKGSEQIVDPIFNILCEYARDWSKDKYHSPYTSIIGPTMIGKSRLLKELSNKTCVVYICLRPKDSTGYPKRSQIADTMLNTSVDDVTTTEEYYVRLLAAILQVVNNFFKRNLSHINPLGEWAEYHSSTGSDFVSEVSSKLAELKSVKRPLWTVVHDLVQSAFFKNLGLKVLLAIDEARALLEPSGENPYAYNFRMFRRALQQIPDSCGIFTVVVDTTSRVSNFSPSARHDPSARPHGPKSNKLYAPLYKIRTHDKMVVTTPPRDLNTLAEPQRLVGYGVPYFSICYSSLLAKTEQSTLAVDDLLKYALRKLICVQNMAPPPPVTQYVALALLGPTIAIYLNGAPHLSAELTASYGAHCSYLDPEHELQFSHYPSQPVYAAAASNYFRMFPKLLVSCIEHLVVILRQGLISTGDIGELTGRIILMCAMNKALSGTESRWSFPVPVQVESFLETLTGKSGGELYRCLGKISDQNRKKVLSGWMFWNHFQHAWNKPINSKLLLENLFRGLALQGKTHQQAYDEILSIVLPDETKEVMKEENITICGVQVKNRQQDSQHKFPLALTPKNARININTDNPYLVLYISLQTTEKTPSEPSESTKSENPDQSTVITKNSESTTTTNEQEGYGLRETEDRKKTKRQQDLQAFLVLHGLGSFKFLTPEVRAALEKLLSAHSDLAAMHEGDELGLNYAKDLMGSVVYDYVKS